MLHISYVYIYIYIYIHIYIIINHYTLQVYVNACAKKLSELCAKKSSKFVGGAIYKKGGNFKKGGSRLFK